MTEHEMLGWHHRLSRHEFEQALGDGEGLAGRVDATQVCSGSRGPGQPLPAAREGLGLRGGSKNRDARRGLQEREAFSQEPASTASHVKEQAFRRCIFKASS